MREAEQKTCRRCGRLRPLCDYGKDKHRPDGKRFYCKECTEEMRKSRNKKKPISEKNCLKCGMIKPVKDFSKFRNSRDGLHYWCKKCKEDFKEDAGKEEQKRVKIQTWEQVDSIIREMAELQHAIDKEEKVRQYRIDLIRKYSDEAIEPCVCHQVVLMAILEEFLNREHLRQKLSKNRTIFKKSRFGTVGFHRGKITIELRTDYAREMLEKP